MAELGVNEHHGTSVLNYLRFSRYKRSQTIKVVEGCFEDLKDSRLLEETTFTLDEVTEMLDGLEAVVRGEVESELINTSHTNVLLLRQAFQQAEKWHLKLNADISELENRELIEMIADIEEREFAGKGGSRPSFELKKLKPVDQDTTQLLQNEIERLGQENDKLKDRLRAVESRATGILQDKTRLEDDLSRAKGELTDARHMKGRGHDTSDLENQMSAVKMQMEQNMLANSDSHKQIEGDLISTKHRLLEVQEQLEMAEKELEKKFSQTGAYRNMKSMLTKKNDQIKELRAKLRNYEDED